MNVQAQTHFIAKVAGIVLLLNVVPQVASHVSLLLFSPDALLVLSQADSLRILLSYLIQVFAGLTLLFASGKVVRWLDVSGEAAEKTIDSQSFEIALVGLLGIYFAVTGFATIAFEIGRVFAQSFNHLNAFDERKAQLVNSESLASIIYAVTVFCVGVMLVVRRQSVVATLAAIDKRFSRVKQ